MRLTMGLIALTAACLVAFAGPGLAATGTATVKTRHGKLGTFLVDGKGRTLYLFEKDKTKKSTCSGACAAAWPEPSPTTGSARYTAGRTPGVPLRSPAPDLSAGSPESPRADIARFDNS